MIPSNFSSVLLRSIGFLLAGALLTWASRARSAPAPQALWSNGSSIVVIPSQVRIGGFPVQVGSLSIGENVPYLFSLAGGRTGQAVPLPEINDFRTASLSPNGKWIAYVAREGVVVADLAGRTIGVEEHAVGCRWSPDGGSLALLMGKSTSRGDAAAGIGTWDLRKKSRRYHRGDVDRISWGAEDTLYYGLGGGFWAIHTGGGWPSKTRHHGIEVSPDGLYSMDRPGPHWSGVRIVHDRSGVDLSEPTFTALGSFTPKHTADPFWVKDAGHLLCVSVCGLWPQPDSTPEWACRTGLVDVLTSELLVAWPGMSLGPSADGQSVWITDGHAVTPRKLGERTRASRVASGWPYWNRGPDEVHVRTSMQTWGKYGGKAGPPVVNFLTLKVGDFIPRRYPAEPRIVLTDLQGARRATFRVNKAAFMVTLPGEQPRSLDSFEVGQDPVILSSNMTDGGYTIELSLVP
jgi:hypothetical protein